MNDGQSQPAARFDIVVVGNSLASFYFADDLATRQGVSVAIVPSGVASPPIAETIPLGGLVGHSPDTLELLADGVASFGRAFHGKPGAYRRDGHLTLAPETTSVSVMRWTADTLSMAGAEARFLSPDQAREKCAALPRVGSTPRTAFGALWCAFGGIAWMERLREIARRGAREAGVNLGFHEPVAAIESNRGRITGARLADGRRLNAATVVVFDDCPAAREALKSTPVAIGLRPTLVLGTQPLRFPIDRVIESVRPRFTLHVESDGAAIVHAPLGVVADDDRRSLEDTEGAVARAIVDVFPAAAGIRIAWRNRFHHALGVDGQPILGLSGVPGLVLGLGLDAMGCWVEHAGALRLSRLLAGEAEGIASWSADRFAERQSASVTLVGLEDRDGLAARRMAIS